MAYRMKGGKVVWRNFAVDAQQNELLDRIIGSEEFKRAAYQLYDDDSFEFLKKCNSIYSVSKTFPASIPRSFNASMTLVKEG